MAFEKPHELQEHLYELEDNNLSLIQQWQENEQQTEIKRKEFELIKAQKTKEITTLKSTVEENQTRSHKIAKEKQTLEIQTMKGGENLMDRSRYERICAKITICRNLYDKKRAKASNQTVDPTLQLIEIEGHINRVLKFIKLARIADATSVQTHIRHLGSLAKTQKKDEANEELRIAQEEKARRYEENKNKKRFVTGIRKPVMRSEKVKQQQRKVKKVLLSEEQIDILRYLQMNLDEENKKE